MCVCSKLYVLDCVRLYVSMCMSARMSCMNIMHEYLRACITCMHTCVHTYMHAHKHIQIYILSSMYTCMHAHIHTHAHIPVKYSCRDGKVFLIHSGLGRVVCETRFYLKQDGRVPAARAFPQTFQHLSHGLRPSQALSNAKPRGFLPIWFGSQIPRAPQPYFAAYIHTCIHTNIHAHMHSYIMTSIQTDIHTYMHA